MFGIDDPGIWLAYLLAFVCLIFSVGYGLVFWNKDSKNDIEEEE